MALPAHPHRQILIFVRAPVLGTVKTRLARVIGQEAALSLYRGMGRTLVDRLRAQGEGWDLRVCYTPDGCEQRTRVATWLGLDEGQLHPQGSGSLGARMRRALHEAVSTKSLPCLVGSDIPELDASHLLEAFEALEAGADLVIGPSLDGGYYLIGMRAHQPELFKSMPWSTDVVLAETLARARRMGLRTHLLPALRDLDEAADLEAVERSLQALGLSTDPNT